MRESFGIPFFVGVRGMKKPIQSDKSEVYDNDFDRNDCNGR